MLEVQILGEDRSTVLVGAIIVYTVWHSDASLAFNTAVPSTKTVAVRDSLSDHGGLDLRLR